MAKPTHPIDIESDATRAGEYATRGDYHRRLDPHWSYAPIYRRKVTWVDARVRALAEDARILDVGAGEGALVQRYRDQGRNIVGLDAAYASESIRRGDLLDLPFEDRAFDAAFCLDVLEHLPLLDQPKALLEIYRVLSEDGHLLMSVPNLAHLHSRLKFFFTGELTRTSKVEKHPGDRPLVEYRQLIEAAGFTIESTAGIFPTFPLAFRLVNHYPDKMDWLVGLLDTLTPIPGWCFLGMFAARK